MSENEKRLREWIAAQRELSAAMKTTLARELDGALAAARDAALEEAASRSASMGRSWGVMRSLKMTHYAQAAARVAEEIHALRSQPAQQSIPIAKVRDVLSAYRNEDDPEAQDVVAVIDEMSLDLGVPIGAEQSTPVDDEKWELRQEVVRLRAIVQGQETGEVVVYAPGEVIPVAKVRKALDYDEETARAPSYMRADEASAFENGWAAAIRCVEDRLGVPLDAGSEGSDFDKHQRGWEAVMHEAVTMDRPAAPESIGTPCDCSGTPGTHEAGDACLRDEPWSLDEHEHSSLKQCDPSCRGWRSPAAPEGERCVCGHDEQAHRSHFGLCLKTGDDGRLCGCLKFFAEHRP